MSDTTSRFDVLLQGYLENDLTPSESSELLQMLKATPERTDQVLQELVFAELLTATVREIDLREAGPARPISARKLSKTFNARSIRRRRSGSTSTLLWGALAASVALALVLSWMNGWFSPNKDSVVSIPALAEVVQSSGATLQRNGVRESLAVGAALLENDELITDLQSTVALKYKDGTRVEIATDSHAVIESRAGAKHLTLKRGVVAAQVAKQPEGKPMLFATLHANATVLGTRLTLSAGGDAAMLNVEEGKVRFTRTDNKSVDVSSGQFAIAGKDYELEARTVPTASDNLALHRPASASSFFETIDHGKRYTAPAANGNDADPLTMWGARDNKIKPDPNAWWQVDLGLPCVLQRFELVTRQDTFDQPEARTNIEVRASNNADGTNYIVLGKLNGTPLKHRATWTVQVSQPQAFRYLRVVHLTFSHNGFAEFRAFGRLGLDLQAKLPSMPVRTDEKN